LIENCHFTLNKPIAKYNLEFVIDDTFAEKIKTMNFLPGKKLNSSINIQSSINSKNNSSSVINPNFAAFINLFIYLIGFLFYIFGGTFCLIIILKNEFKIPIDKIAWVITIIFAPVIGILLFLFLGRKQIKVENNK